MVPEAKTLPRGPSPSRTVAAQERTVNRAGVTPRCLIAALVVGTIHVLSNAFAQTTTACDRQERLRPSVGEMDPATELDTRVPRKETALLLPRAWPSPVGAPSPKRL